MENLSINDPPPAPAKKFVKRDTLLENEAAVQKRWEEAHVFEANAEDRLVETTHKIEHKPPKTRDPARERQGPVFL